MPLHRLRLARPGIAPDWAKNAYLKLREVNAHKRALPDFLVIGAQKAGSTSASNKALAALGFPMTWM